MNRRDFLSALLGVSVGYVTVSNVAEILSAPATGITLDAVRLAAEILRENNIPGGNFRGIEGNYFIWTYPDYEQDLRELSA